MKRETVNLKIAYFVKPDFSNTFRGDLRKLEMQVEDDYITHLRQSCYRERSYSKQLLQTVFCFFFLLMLRGWAKTRWSNAYCKLKF